MNAVLTRPARLRAAHARVAAQYSAPMELDGIIVLQSVDEIPENRDDIPDEALISIEVWAVLQGVSKGTVNSNRSRHNKRRGTPEARSGDMPEEDMTLARAPFWRMATFRAWERPGKGAGAGRPAGTGGRYTPRAPRTLQLPGDCPHCGTTIRRKELPAAKTKTRRSLKLPAICPHCGREIRGEDLLAVKEPK